MGLASATARLKREVLSSSQTGAPDGLAEPGGGAEGGALAGGGTLAGGRTLAGGGTLGAGASPADQRAETARSTNARVAEP
jgi:hypothetical protein